MTTMETNRKQKDVVQEAQEVLDWLYERSVQMCELVGGYPDEISTAMRGYVVIAGLDNTKERNGPELRIHRWEDLLVYWRMAVDESQSSDGDLSIFEAMDDLYHEVPLVTEGE